MYQVTHKQFGIFQGLHAGALFWSVYSMSPFLGIFPFSSTEEVDKFLTAVVALGPIKEDFVVEKFDSELDEKLRTHSPHFAIPGNC